MSQENYLLTLVSQDYLEAYSFGTIFFWKRLFWIIVPNFMADVVTLATLQFSVAEEFRTVMYVSLVSNSDTDSYGK